MRRFAGCTSTTILFSWFLLFAVPQPGLAKEHLTLQLPWYHQFQFAGYYIAQERGYYRAADLEVEIRPVEKHKSTVQAVLSGEADFGISSSGLLVERSQGKPVVAVATILQRSPTIFLTLKRSAINSPQDLAGKRVMLAPGHKSLSLLALLHKYGLISKIIAQETSYNLNSLFNNDTDAFNGYSTNEPFLAREQGYDVNIINPHDYGINFYGDTLFTTETLAHNKPKLVEKFRQATLKGWRYALENPTETIALIKKNYAVEKSTAALEFEAEALRKVIQPELTPLGQTDLATWAQMTHHLISIGAISPDFHLSSDFIFPPPAKIDWARLGPWIAICLGAIVVLISLLSWVARTNYLVKSSLKKLKSSELRYQQLVENIPGLIYTFSPALPGGVYYSPHIKSILGYSVEELSANPLLWHNSIHPDDRKSVDAALARIERDRTYELEYRIQDKQGNWHWFTDRFSKRMDPERGEIVDGIATDITERVVAEELQQQSERRFRDLIEQVVGIAIQGYNEERKIIFWNKASEQLYGFSEAEALGRQLEELIIPEQMRAEVIQRIRNWVETGQEIPAGELVLVGKNGQDVPVFSSHVMRDTPTGKEMFCIDIDFRPIKETEAQRQELEEQLRQRHKIEAIGTMAGGIAHDFNNHLAIILGNIELAELKLPADSPVRRYIGQVKTAATRSRDLVRQILIYSRRNPQSLQPICPARIVEETIELLRPTIPSSVKIECTIVELAEKTKISADPTQFQQILINLCNNAVHAMNEEGILRIALISVELTSSDLPTKEPFPAGSYLNLSVEDTGCGIPADILEKIFDPFFTTKEVHQGTGMGLAVVQGIVSSHGGFIRAVSNPGHGSRFDIYLPATGTVGMELIQKTAPLPKGTERILVLDDEENLANMCAEILREYHYQVSISTSSHQVLEQFQRNPDQYDLLISDQTMPEMPGTELAKQLLKIRPDLPIILCTGYSSKVTAGTADQIGIRRFCMKPLNLQELVKITREVLDMPAKPSTTIKSFE